MKLKFENDRLIMNAENENEENLFQDLREFEDRQARNENFFAFTIEESQKREELSLLINWI